MTRKNNNEVCYVITCALQTSANKDTTILVNHNVIPMSLLKNSAILSITISK